MVEIFRIVLRDTKRFDAYETREFDLPIDDTAFPIGRASHNVTKPELMPAQHNAYIDSPVVSRQHAVFTANASSGKPEVYITDRESMHGTMLNEKRLAVNVPAKLSSGDKLQFGTDVNRNEEYFVARTYVFESQLQLQRNYSLGFAVPDPDSEEDSLVAPLGSQVDPLVIDDSDAGSSQSDVEDNDGAEDAEADVTIAATEDRRQDKPSALLSPPEEEYPEAPQRTTVVDEEYDEDEGIDAIGARRDDSLVSGSPSDSVLREYGVLDTDFDSEAESVGSSEISYDSDMEVKDSEDEEAQDAELSNLREIPATQEFKPSSTFAVPTEQPSITSQPTGQPELYSMDDLNCPARLSRLDAFGQSYDSNSIPYNNLFANRPNVSMKVSGAEDKPPNKSASHSEYHATASSSTSTFAPWNNSAFDTFGQQGGPQAWYSDEMPSCLRTNPSDCHAVFSPARPPPTQGSVEAYVPVLSLIDDFPGPVHQENQTQTPPLMPQSDVDASTPLQPGRRTKVTIEEIVEEQPLTPESINNLKRKADVFEEVERAVSQNSAAVSDESATAVQTAATIAQRPKKVPRSILSKALSKATYPLLGVTGAAVSFALLSTLPDSFFT